MIKTIIIDELCFSATGVNFIIFNGSLKSADGLECRATVVEDGIMAQVTMKGLTDLKAALKAMRGMSFKPAVDASATLANQQEVVSIEWTDAPKSCNIGCVVEHNFFCSVLN